MTTTHNTLPGYTMNVDRLYPVFDFEPTIYSQHFNVASPFRKIIHRHFYTCTYPST